jgi:hypothetical protein
MADQNQILIDALKQTSVRSNLQNAENVKIFQSIAKSLYKQQESLQNIERTLKLESQNSFVNTFSSVFARPLEKILKAIESTKQKSPTLSSATTVLAKDTKEQKPAKVENVGSKPADQAQNTKLQQLEEIQSVSIDAFGGNSLESLNKSLLDVLPQAIKEGLKDFAKDLNKTLKNLAKAVEEQEAGGAGGGILEALGLSSLFGGGKGKAGKPPKAGAPGKPSAAVKGGPRRAGLGLASMLGGAVLAAGASWATGKLLGKDEELEKVNTEDLKQFAEQAKETNNAKDTELAKAQTQAQKKDVKIEGAQTVAGYTGFMAGQKVATKLVASAKATRVWRVFMVYIKRKAPSIFAKIGTKLAAAAGLAAIPVVGWVGAAINIGFTIWTAYDLYQLWKEFSALSDIEMQYFADEVNSEPMSDDQLPIVKSKEDLQAEKQKLEAQLKNPRTRNKGDIENKIAELDKQIEAGVTSTTASAPTATPINVDKNLPSNDKKSAELGEDLFNAMSSSEAQRLFQPIEERAEEKKAQRTEEKKKIEEEFSALNKQLEEEKLAQTSFNKLDRSDKQEMEKYKIREDRIFKLQGEIRTAESRLKKVNDYLEKTDKVDVAMAEGGVVTKPTKALVGEAGPEAVIPLNKFDLTSLKSNSFAKAETILEKIANNTGSTNQGLSNLINGFNNLAKALKESGTIAQAPVVVNNSQMSPQAPRATSSQVAGLGNPDISNFRLGVVEASRFVAV